jgi:tRNA U34 5-methylaminomethyl-2-thiouridine-forming methyltransferase MnmC
VERRIVRTADGSLTLQLPGWQEQYHSLHGALQEAYHVFIDQGLRGFSHREIALLEVGFGTGLNALITLLEAPRQSLSVHYSALEAYPVTRPEWEALDYGRLFTEAGAPHAFAALHEAAWETEVPITETFRLWKRQLDFRELLDAGAYDLVYFDAFGARVQPELWTEAVFSSMYRALRPGGCLVTYAAKGSVRRAMQAVGFRVERLPGPPGKREMLRAWREP